MARIIYSFLLLLVLAVWVGCKPQGQQTADQLQQQVVAQETKTENLREAMRFTDQIADFNRSEATKEIGYQLNAWMVTDRNDILATRIPEIIKTLPEDVRNYPPLARVDSREFTSADVAYLTQSRLFSSVANWSQATNVSAAYLKAWLDAPALASGKKLSESGVSELQLAFKLFDWTIRNVQLEGDAGDVEVLPKDPRLPVTDNGLGYRQLPWQTLIYGRGDFVERGRVFSELARQRNIPTVWLAIGAADSIAPNSVWLMGVLIEDEIFLFDSKLGLPIPGPDQKGIATLREAQEDESILRRLNIPGLFKYPLDSKGVKSVVALVDADPSMISGRMKRLQESLTSEFRTELWLDVDGLAERLKKLPQLAAVKSWSLPILARVYAEDLEKRLQEENEFTFRYNQKFLLYLNDTPLLKAKYEHLFGKWENSLDEDGAMKHYMDCRIPEEDLNNLKYDSNLQNMMGVERFANEPLEKFEARLEQASMVYREAKIDATVLIGLLHYDQANYDATLNWLAKRAQTLKGAQRWQSSIWYNVARAYEADGKYTEAIEQLRKTPTSQEAGNRIRARLLQRLTGTEDSAEGAAQP